MEGSAYAGVCLTVVECADLKLCVWIPHFGTQMDGWATFTFPSDMERWVSVVYKNVMGNDLHYYNECLLYSHL